MSRTPHTEERAMADIGDILGMARSLSDGGELRYLILPECDEWTESLPRKIIARIERQEFEAISEVDRVTIEWLYWRAVAIYLFGPLPVWKSPYGILYTRVAIGDEIWQVWELLP